MHIHVLGVCGTFMGGVAVLARQAGHRVTGCDANVYPPMSTQLAEQGIELIEGFEPAQIRLKPDVFVVGNVVSRGNALMEEILNRGLPYVSGPQWLSEQVLRGKWVQAIAGTHGKTTTTAMLAFILEQAGLNPGFLVGGVAHDFPVSARLANSQFFVIEADEYDTALFDKRSNGESRCVVDLCNDLDRTLPIVFAFESLLPKKQRQIAHIFRSALDGSRDC